MIRGTVTVDNVEIEDFGVRKSNGDPLFILANVVDDADMRITHVIRGEDHVTNTTKYVLLWEALGYGPLPTFAHLPLLYNEARKKLSKRRDKVAVEDYRDEGYLPEAMRNYLALLGWSPGDNREILTLDELVAEFRLEDVKSAGAIFDERKLQSVNAEYLRALPTAELVERSQAWLRGSVGAAGPAGAGAGPHPGGRLRPDRLPLSPEPRHRPRRVGPRRPEVSGLRRPCWPPLPAGTRPWTSGRPTAIRERHRGRRRGRRPAQAPGRPGADPPGGHGPLGGPAPVGVPGGPGPGPDPGSSGRRPGPAPGCRRLTPIMASSPGPRGG